MIKKEYTTVVTEYQSESELSEIDKTLIHEAKTVAKKAYAPYSNLNVGASVLLENDEIISSNNQENTAYPSGMCAERVALFYANSKYPNIGVKSIAICSFNKTEMNTIPISPCGSCRQVMLETELRFNKPIKVIMVGSEKIIVTDNVKQLLPLYFKI